MVAQNGITIEADVKAWSSLYLDADSDADGVGTLTINKAVACSVNGCPIELAGAVIDVNSAGNVDAKTGIDALPVVPLLSNRICRHSCYSQHKSSRRWSRGGAAAGVWPSAQLVGVVQIGVINTPNSAALQFSTDELRRIDNEGGQ